MLQSELENGTPYVTLLSREEEGQLVLEATQANEDERLDSDRERGPSELKHRHTAAARDAGEGPFSPL